VPVSGLQVPSRWRVHFFAFDIGSSAPSWFKRAVIRDVTSFLH
jgi:hypothetical protein